MKKSLLWIAVLLLLVSSCQNKQPASNLSDSKVTKISDSLNLSFLIHEWNSTITTIMVGDGFSPLLASRTYAYPNIAAFEVLENGKKKSSSNETHFNTLEALPQPDSAKTYCYELAAVQAFATVSKKLVYREQGCDELLAKHLSYFKDSLHLDEEVIKNSQDYGTAIGLEILKWAKEDRYAQTKAKPKYIFGTTPDKWIPTASEFRSALEPYWGTLRTFSGINPLENSVPFEIPFSEKKGSKFYQLVDDVYQKSKTVTDEEKSIALYWDDNPDQMTFKGHVPTTRRRISPTAHWIGITGEACKERKLNFDEALRCYMLASVSIADALICCWHQKYETNLVRPVTYISKNIEQDWMPFIQTPPFPEHTSGHASVSFSCATVLTSIFGENYHFTDKSLVEYGLNERSFNSFYEAAEQAAMSRFYAGIHYTTGLEGGKQQGKKAGSYVIDLIEKNNGL